MDRLAALIVGIALLAGACADDNDPVAQATSATTPIAEATIDAERRAEIYADAEPVEVLLASADIAEGTSWAEAQQHIEVGEVPIAVRPATFVLPNDPQVTDDMVAIGLIPQNQIIVAALFTDPTN